MGRFFDKFKNKIKDCRGMVIVESTIVFPVMFFVLFFILYIGNAYYQIAQVDDCVERAAIKGAQCIANPQQYETVDEGMIPLSIKDVEPYRYIFGEIPGGSIDEIEKKIGDDLIREINESTVSFFIKMNPNIVGDTGNIAEFNNYILYSTFSVELEYEITFPIRFFGASEPTILKMQSHAEVSVSDTPEFVRNIDMVADMFVGTKIGDGITDAFTKVNNFIKTFAGTAEASSGTSGGSGEGPTGSEDESTVVEEESTATEEETTGSELETTTSEEETTTSQELPTDIPIMPEIPTTDDEEETTEPPIIKTYSEYAKEATHEGTTNIVVLGKYKKDKNEISYDRVAKAEEATYFSMSNWDEVEALIGDKGMWNINKEFLNQQWAEGKEFYLSHDPWEADRTYEKEILHLIDLGVVDFVKEGNMWKAVRP